eukprot:TRINITY_DN8681_c0_g1_i1.p1 TRINITY_DN8681_c0_g1~~TRINITY_DN8681_c0_g1_i1.p1  ORF type:complete len:554 (-),score=122.57 TRINITY_DN8681_c0_g1_i1:70-1731(-)
MMSRSLARKMSTSTAGAGAESTGVLGFLRNHTKKLVAAAVLGAAIADEGTRRSLEFWTFAFPVFLHYRFVQWQTAGKSDEEITKAFDKLHTRYAPATKFMCTRLRGFYLKQAQMMGTLDDFIPPAYLEWCKEMQDQVPTAFAPGQARTIVEKSLGKPLEQVFQSWNDIPRGSASIGQVHHAVLLDGREVAVKVQFPNIEKQFRADLKTTKRFCEMALPQHVQPLEEIEKQFLTEFDYSLEAENLETIYNNIMPTWSEKVRIPKPIKELCTKDVLVMEYLHGVRLIDGIRNSFRKYAEKDGKTLEDIEKEQKEQMRNGTFVYRDVASEKWRIKCATAFMKVRDYTLNTFKFIYNWSLGLLLLPRLEYNWTEPLLNLGEIVETLHHVHAHQIYLDGAFNGDPHPGNILLLNDGRIGLVDYGQVKHISPLIREQLSKMTIALANDDKEKLIDILWNEIGAKGKYGKKDVAYRLATFWYDRNTKDILGDMNIAEFLDWAQAEDPVEKVHPEFVMVSRVSVLLRGMGNAFGLQLRTTDFWRVYAERVLLEKEKNAALE